MLYPLCRESSRCPRRPGPIGPKANRNKDWSGQHREAAPSPDIESNSEIDRDFYLLFITTAIERAIVPDAAWYCWHASARQAMLEAVWNEVGAFMHQQIIWVKSRPFLPAQPSQRRRQERVAQGH